jgi:hypothetical protein
VKIFVFLVAILVPTVLQAQDRPRMASLATPTRVVAEPARAPSPVNSSIKDVLKTAEKAVNDEDLDAFMECFSPERQAVLRRRFGILFVEHEMGMEVSDSHVLSCDGESGELAVKYTFRLSSENVDIVALISFKKSDEGWKIIGENIRSSRSDAPVAYTPPPARSGVMSGCASGSCGPSIEQLLEIGNSGCSGGRCGVR